MARPKITSRLIHGDCLQVLPTLAADSFDAVVTDPPAGIGFMGKTWDSFETAGGKRISQRLPTVTVGGTPNRNPICRACGGRQRGEPKRAACACEVPDFDAMEWRHRGRQAFIAFLSAIMVECFRVAKPGAYALVWAIPRTSHWTGTAIENAGWVIQDRISHLFGQGFPKHKSKLKPACEDWWLAWKPDRRATPLPGLDACRIGTTVETWPASRSYANGRMALSGREHGNAETQSTGNVPAGRWPANVTLDEVAAAMLDEQSGIGVSRRAETVSRSNGVLKYGGENGRPSHGQYQRETTGEDSGGASRFFYVAKASRAERNAGLEGMPERELCHFGDDACPRRNGASSGGALTNGTGKVSPQANTHPTVKPLALMRWLCRLITPPGGTVLDPFAGSGSTLVACQQEGFSAVGIEREAEYIAIARKRLAAARKAAA